MAALIASELLHRLKGHDLMAGAIAWSPDGKRLASVSNAPGLIVHDLARNKRLLVNRDPFNASVSWRAGSSLVAVVFRSNLALIDTANEEVFELDIASEPI